jgi:hypothetical protein
MFMYTNPYILNNNCHKTSFLRYCLGLFMLLFSCVGLTQTTPVNLNNQLVGAGEPLLAGKFSIYLKTIKPMQTSLPGNFNSQQINSFPIPKKNCIL